MTGQYVGWKKALRVAAMATIVGIGTHGPVLAAANCSNAVPDWIAAFNNSNYHDCLGPNRNATACNHLDLVYNTCCAGASGTGNTATCVEGICNKTILVDSNGALLNKAADCNNP